MFVSNFALSFHVILAPFVMIKLMWSFRMLFEIYPYHFHYLCVLLFVDPKPTVVAPLLPDCCASFGERMRETEEKMKLVVVKELFLYAASLNKEGREDRHFSLFT